MEEKFDVLNELGEFTGEVADIKYFPKEEVIRRIDNNYEDLTEKTVAWPILKKILKRY